MTNVDIQMAPLGASGAGTCLQFLPTEMEFKKELDVAWAVCLLSAETTFGGSTSQRHPQLAFQSIVGHVPPWMPVVDMAG